MKPETNFEHLFKQFNELLPRNLFALHEDMEKNLRAALNSALARMDLVTREEFEIQAALLLRARARLEELEKRVARLESEIGRQTED